MSTAGIPTTPLSNADQQWEYRVLHVDVDGWIFGPTIDPQALNDQLNVYGDDGWELVHVIDVSRGQGRTSDLIVLFKRPRRR
ncbi:MAG: DUF4177 domain-containing protein [Chloroflexales bacterium]|nr:DUF4177 domain-containing protein [Chloroflexales bacterium]